VAALQRGMRLLHRAPALDIVKGVQCAGLLGDLLDDEQQRLVPVAANDLVHIHEEVNKRRRGLSVTAWLNIVYGRLEDAPAS
jgi:hypothetical protein